MKLSWDNIWGKINHFYAIFSVFISSLNAASSNINELVVVLCEWLSGKCHQWKWLSSLLFSDIIVIINTPSGNKFPGEKYKQHLRNTRKNIYNQEKMSSINTVVDNDLTPIFPSSFLWLNIVQLKLSTN